MVHLADVATKGQINDTECAISNVGYFWKHIAQHGNPQQLRVYKRASLAAFTKKEEQAQRQQG